MHSGSPSKGTASPSKSPNKSFSFSMSPERQKMINDQEEKLGNLTMEMEQLRSQHASPFKGRPENHAGTVRDFASGSSDKLSSPVT